MKQAELNEMILESLCVMEGKEPDRSASLLLSSIVDLDDGNFATPKPTRDIIPGLVRHVLAQGAEEDNSDSEGKRGKKKGKGGQRTPANKSKGPATHSSTRKRKK